jgi:hypothetical protein
MLKQHPKMIELKYKLNSSIKDTLEKIILRINEIVLM